MRKSFHLLFVTILSEVVIVDVIGQDNYASNIRTSLSDDQKLFINYDIVVNIGSKFFKVELEFDFRGEKIDPNPNNLYGDYGRAMTPGNKIIYWNYGDDFEGDINQVNVKVFAYKELHLSVIDP